MESELSNGITTLIPIFFDSGIPPQYLRRALDSIVSQSVLPAEIIISDDTTDLTFFPEVLTIMRQCKVPIKYLKNRGEKGMAGNSNNALSKVETKYVHILHCDDRLISNTTYQEILDFFLKASPNWIFVGGIVADRKVTPSINNFLILGKNTLGGPSGMFSLASCYEPYETRLRMLVDVYQYQEMIENFGLPTIFPDAYIEYGVGAWQVQKSVDSREYVNELSFIFGNSASAKTYSRELLTSKGDFELKILTLRALFKTGELSLLIFSLNFCLLKFKFQFSRFKNKLHQFF